MRLPVHTKGLVQMTPLFVLLGASNVASAQDSPVTFAKDIAPIFQAKCQTCHRPGEIAPMSLLTFEDARPWARAIKAKVVAGEMPPWFIDKTVGIQRYKNDASLSDEQVAKIVKWVDSGAPLGNAKDLPPGKHWPAGMGWQLADRLGPPDLVVKSKPWTQPAEGQDQWWEPVVATDLAEERWVRAVEVRPSERGRRIVHHAVINIPNVERARDLGEYAFAEFSIGSYGEAYPENYGKRLQPGTKFRFEIHYHSVGAEITDQTEVGIYFYPKGYVPKYEIMHVPIGLTGIAGRAGSAGIDIPPNTRVRTDAYMVLQKPAIVHNFKPHMHMRGAAMTMSVLYPDGRYETLASVNRYNFNWHVSYVFADDVAPLLPKGSIIHIESWHDNTAANKNNPDPSQWVGSGPRSIDEMTHAHTNMTYLSEEEFQRKLEERRKATNTAHNQ